MAAARIGRAVAASIYLVVSGCGEGNKLIGTWVAVDGCPNALITFTSDHVTNYADPEGREKRPPVRVTYRVDQDAPNLITASSRHGNVITYDFADDDHMTMENGCRYERVR